MSLLGNVSSDPAMQVITDASFDSFIESDAVMDNETLPSGPTSTPGNKKNGTKKGAKKMTPLSALPSRLSTENMERHTTPNSPGTVMNEFINYTQTSGSTVTTPTTSNSSSLHNLSFDLFDGSDGAASIPGGNEGFSPDADMSNVATPSATTNANSHFFNTAPHRIDGTMTDLMGMQQSTMPNPLFGGMNDLMVMPLNPMSSMQQPFQRTVDDMGHQFGHHQTGGTHHHAGGHHQRSLSLRDMTGTMAGGIQAFTPQALATFGFSAHGNGQVKMEQGMGVNGMPAYPIPGNPATMQNLNQIATDPAADKPRVEKKRRLTSTSDNDAKETTPKGAKANNGKKAAANGNASRRSRSNTATKKATGKEKVNNDDNGGKDEQEADALTPTSLFENVAQNNASSFTQPSNNTSPDDQAKDQDSPKQDAESDGKKSAKKTGVKRPPPSAFQITEAGMPFPVIDTSAKHSSLFIPPDTSGLTKREARLVKNRAAAFLSRQRKREQFEELEIKCRNLCRLVWKMWEAGSGVLGNEFPVDTFADQERFSAFLVQQEGEEVEEIFETVLALKGGSIAPTEDGQLQGAVAAGIKSENGKIVGDASAVVHIPSSAAKAAEEASKELARLRSEIEEFKKREIGMQAELAEERGLRLKMEFEMRQREQEQKPFRGGSQCDLSLTEPASFDDEEMEDEDVDADESNRNLEKSSDKSTTSKKDKKNAQSTSANVRPSRASQRLQRNGQNSLAMSSHNNTTNSNVTAAGQKKAASAALMMVLFSFALFGLPGGQTGRVGGIARGPGASDQFPLGRVLGAPMTGSRLAADDDEEMYDQDATTAQLPPSSHLSVDDLFPAMHDVLQGKEQRDEDRLGNNKGNSFNFDYQAFAKDLESSLEWDMQQGFLVLGGDDEDEDDESNGEKKEKIFNSANLKKNIDGQDEQKGEMKDAPTKLTLFVPAPDLSSVNSDSISVADGSEDHFYDAPLAGDVDEQPQSQQQHSSTQTVSEQQRELTQVEATRAALQVLRNHRVAREAAAFAASRRFNKQPSPSNRVGSPLNNEINNVGSTDAYTVDKKEKEEDEEEEEDDFSHEVLQTKTTSSSADSTTDRIRGTDFYQLEFSLSGAKVRNVAELARLLGSMRGAGGGNVKAL